MGVLSNLTSSGFTFSDYPTTLDYVQTIFKNIYGQDIYLGNDSKDGQLAAAFALAIYDTNAQFAQIINALSPTYAQGTQLSTSVLINGIARQPATNSTVTLTLTGTAGTIISNAQAKDANGYIWNIANGTIGGGGTVNLQATCQTSGAIAALPNTITNINTPIFGWTSVTNSTSATLGVDAESDASLRQRQKTSTALPAVSVIGGLLGALRNVTGVTRAKVYENDTNSTDANGLIPHSIAAVVEGGVTQDIVNTIGVRKNEGCGTNGTTTGTYTDQYGIPTTIKFYQAAYTQIEIHITLQALTGWATSVQTEISNSIIGYINNLDIGDDVLYSKIWTYANLLGASDNLKYNITSLTICTVGGTPATSDIVVPFNYAAYLNSANIYYTVV